MAPALACVHMHTSTNYLRELSVAACRHNHAPASSSASPSGLIRRNPHRQLGPGGAALSRGRRSALWGADIVEGLLEPFLELLNSVAGGRIV